MSKQSANKLNPTTVREENKEMEKLNTFSDLELDRDNYLVMNAYCFRNKILLLIFQKSLQFYNAVLKPNSDEHEWILIESVPIMKAKQVKFLKDHAYYTISSSGQVNGAVYCKLYKFEDDRDGRPITQLVASMYHCNADAGTVKELTLELESIEGKVKDENFCVLNDGSLFVCLAIVKEPGESYRTRIRKYSLSKELNSLKVPMRFNFTVCPLDYLRPVHESASFVVGRQEHSVYLWDHKDNNYWHVTSLIDMNVSTAPLHLVTEVSGVLHLVFERHRHFEVISSPLMSIEGNKIISKYKFSDNFKEAAAVTMLPGVFGAVFKNGFCIWEKKSTTLLMEDESKDMRIVIFPGTHYLVWVRDRCLCTIPFVAPANKMS